MAIKLIVTLDGTIFDNKTGDIIEEMEIPAERIEILKREIVTKLNDIQVSEVVNDNIHVLSVDHVQELTND